MQVVTWQQCGSGDHERLHRQKHLLGHHQQGGGRPRHLVLRTQISARCFLTKSGTSGKKRSLSNQNRPRLTLVQSNDTLFLLKVSSYETDCFYFVIVNHRVLSNETLFLKNVIEANQVRFLNLVNIKNERCSSIKTFKGFLWGVELYFSLLLIRFNDIFSVNCSERILSGSGFEPNSLGLFRPRSSIDLVPDFGFQCTLKPYMVRGHP